MFERAAALHVAPGSSDRPAKRGEVGHRVGARPAASRKPQFTVDTTPSAVAFRSSSRIPRLRSSPPCPGRIHRQLVGERTGGVGGIRHQVVRVHVAGERRPVPCEVRIPGRSWAGGSRRRCWRTRCTRVEPGARGGRAVRHDPSSWCGIPLRERSSYRMSMRGRDRAGSRRLRHATLLVHDEVLDNMEILRLGLERESLRVVAVGAAVVHVDVEIAAVPAAALQVVDYGSKRRGVTTSAVTCTCGRRPDTPGPREISTL